MSGDDRRLGRAGRLAAAGGFAVAALWMAFTVLADPTEIPAQAATATLAPTVPDPERVERGRYLVTIMACGDCHTPFVMGPEGPRPDTTRLLSGHPQDFVVDSPPALGDGPWMWAGTGTNTAFAGPWGITYATNLTPDENTGLGIWTEEIFVDAIRTGRHYGQSRPILPPMPWESFRHATDEDLGAIYAYLRSIPPVHNRVPDYTPPGGDVDEVAAWSQTLRSEE